MCSINGWATGMGTKNICRGEWEFGTKSFTTWDPDQSMLLSSATLLSKSKKFTQLSKFTLKHSRPKKIHQQSYNVHDTLVQMFKREYSTTCVMRSFQLMHNWYLNAMHSKANNISKLALFILCANCLLCILDAQ